MKPILKAALMATLTFTTLCVGALFLGTLLGLFLRGCNTAFTAFK